MKTWTIESDSMFRSVWSLRAGGTRRQAFEWYCRKLGLDPEKEGAGDMGGRSEATFFCRGGHNGFILYFHNPPKTPDAEYVGLVTHEALHAAFHILSLAGVKNVNPDSEECFTYFTQYVVREVYAKLWPERKK